ncbi:NACHT, LRR and PYD domains-containing protein 3-like [Scyliorhinus canicula]|uniref:NACHT, LRR and PYD domains-containing protein 3-like n=1 Tax=Scyliorhinus canicula TaxID=7830 RepID=UPI0018F7267D|nr:NACHT, LRR and PYD domains-containing protein 3-like [Scyliorhinus canicula]
MERIIFYGFVLTPIDCVVLSHAIELSETIKDLDLRYSYIQYEGLQRLGRVLHKCQGLRLGRNELGDSGVKLVSAALRNPDCKIQELELKNNALTDSCVEDLASALSTNWSLTVLNLGNNKLGDSGVKKLLVALRNPDCKIHELWLESVGLTDHCAQDLASAFGENKLLTFLNLKSNFLTDQSVSAFCQFVLTCKSLEQIHLGQNNFSVQGKRQLESLQESRLNRKLKLTV